MFPPKIAVTNTKIAAVSLPDTPILAFKFEPAAGQGPQNVAFHFMTRLEDTYEHGFHFITDEIHFVTEPILLTRLRPTVSEVAE